MGDGVAERTTGVGSNPGHGRHPLSGHATIQTAGSPPPNREWQKRVPN